MEIGDCHGRTADGRGSQADGDDTVSGDHGSQWPEHAVLQFCRHGNLDRRRADSADDNTRAGGAAKFCDRARGDNATHMASNRDDDGRY